ncbi:MAG: hypothetical protein IPH54_22735 [Rhodoferax sp.]|nr:hypothetical protein [Rhodoferax sp.]
MPSWLWPAPPEFCPGCAVVAVADAAVTTVAVVVKTGGRRAGAVAGVAIDVARRVQKTIRDAK